MKDDRRSFLTSAAGAVTTLGALGIAPLLKAKSPTGKPAGESQAAVGALTPGQLPVSYYVSIRHIGPFQDVNTTWARLTQFAQSHGVAGAGVVSFATACPCNDINAPIESESLSPSQYQYDACISLTAAQYQEISEALAKSPENFAGVAVGKVSLGNTQFVVHNGPYSTIADTYRAALGAGATLFSSLKPNGSPVAVEVYKNNPLLTKPSALVTEIHFPAGASYSTTGPLLR